MMNSWNTVWGTLVRRLQGSLPDASNTLLNGDFGIIVDLVLHFIFALKVQNYINIMDSVGLFLVVSKLLAIFVITLLIVCIRHIRH